MGVVTFLLSLSSFLFLAPPLALLLSLFVLSLLFLALPLSAFLFYMLSLSLLFLCSFSHSFVVIIFLRSRTGQIMETHSVSAGLDYPGVGPEHAFFKDSGRAEYVCVTDGEAMEAFQLLSQREGIIPALESAHAVAHAMKV